MPDVIRCARCGQANRVPAVEAGKKAVCGKCGAPLTAGGKPAAVSDATFRKVIGDSERVVVDFWAPWCGPCRIIAPVIEQLASERADVTFAKLNVDENPATSATYRVSGIPTLIFFRGGEEKGRVVGAVGRQQLEQAMAHYLG